MTLRGGFKERMMRRSWPRRGIRLALGLAVGGLLAVAAPSALWAAPSAGCAAVNGGALDYTATDATGANKGIPLPFTAGEVVTATFSQLIGNYSPGIWDLSANILGGGNYSNHPNPANNDTNSLTIQANTGGIKSEMSAAGSGGTGSGAVKVTHVCTGTAAAQAPDLTITKTHNGNATAGQTGFQYNITVSNSGTASTSGTVTVMDTLPSGLTATAISGSGWNCTVATSTCTRSDALGNGASYPAITLTVNVASNAPSSLVNSATVSGGGESDTSNDTAIDPTTVNAAPAPATTNTSLVAVPSAGLYGQSIQLSAQVSSSGGTPTGTVVFTVGATTLGSAPLSGGNASISTTAIPVGNQTITATYTPADSSFAGSSGTTQVFIYQALTATTITSTTNPTTAGQTANFTVTVAVAAPGSGTPTGTVTVNFGDGSPGSVVPLTNGSASPTHVYASPGNYTVTATYNGDTNFMGSTSSPLSQQVNQASTGTGLQSSQNRAR